MNAIIPALPEQYEHIKSGLLTTLARSSQVIYLDTFTHWERWCTEHGLNVLEMSSRNVLDFIESQDTTLTTRKRQKSAFASWWKYLWLMTGDSQAERAYRLVSALRLTAETAGGQERTKQPLSPKQAQQMIDLEIRTRDQAMIALMLTTGLRRSEIAALKWSDIHFERGVLTVRHGKRDKAREVPVPDGTLEKLRLWQMEQPAGYIQLFTPLRRNGAPGADRPLSGTDVYRTWAKYATLLGLESKPHDARRTYITEVIRRADTRTAQAVAGHERAETTLSYAQGVEVDELRKKLKLSYG